MSKDPTKTESNQDLRALYQKVYEQGSENFYTFSGIEESEAIIQIGRDLWERGRVLEIGCGEGDLACMLTIQGAKVSAIDYAESAIKICREKFHLQNLEFRCCSYEDIQEKFDVVVMQGTLEHFDDPYAALEKFKNDYLNPAGCIITSSPSFLNPRGYIWMALVKLFNVPMSLSDRHSLCPFDFEVFAENLCAKLTYQSVNQDWGHGERLIIDFRKRLVNALRDAGIDDSGVEGFLEWLGKTTRHTTYEQFTGASVAYRLQF